MPAKRVILMAGVAVALLAIGIAIALRANRPSHIEITGRIQKVRTQALDENGTAVFIDLRMTNPSKHNFIVRDVLVTLDTAKGDTVTGATAADADVDRLFEFFPAAGPRYNPTFKTGDRVGPGESFDRMVTARIDLPEADVRRRRGLTVRFTDVDAIRSEIAESEER